MCAARPRFAFFAHVIAPLRHLVPAATAPIAVQLEPSQREKVVSDVHLRDASPPPPPLEGVETAEVAAAAAAGEEEVGWTARFLVAAVVKAGATKDAEILGLADLVLDVATARDLDLVVAVLVGATGVALLLAGALLEEEPLGEMVIWRLWSIAQGERTAAGLEEEVVPPN